VQWSRHLDELVDSQIVVAVSAANDVIPLQPGNATTISLSLTRPDVGLRRRLWDRHLPKRHREAALTLDHLAFRFRGSARSIAKLARLAIDHASLSTNDVPKVGIEDLNTVSHAMLAGRLSGLGTLEPSTE